MREEVRNWFKQAQSDLALPTVRICWVQNCALVFSRQNNHRAVAGLAFFKTINVIAILFAIFGNGSVITFFINSQFRTFKFFRS